MNVKVTIVQPSTNSRGGHTEPQRETTREIFFHKGCTPKQMCDGIFMRFGNHYDPAVWFPWFREVNNQQMYSLSIGAVIKFEREAYICANTGWLHVTLPMADSWLLWQGERSYGDLWSLKKWSADVGFDMDAHQV